MAKRVFDVLFAVLVLVATAPVMLAAMFLVFRHDGHSPLYEAVRVGLHNREFVMIKIRSMRINAEKTGVSSTSANDNRITRIGHFIRKYKLDEVSQFWNVLVGDMSTVGPRPQVRGGGVDQYTPEEMRLLTVRPGITDLSSIVFSDEGTILAGAEDPDRLYDQIIRPWKSRLGLLYVDNRKLWLDLRVIWLTVLAVSSKATALQGVAKILEELNADENLRRVCLRQSPLPEGTPPGMEAPSRA